MKNIVYEHLEAVFLAGLERADPHKIIRGMMHLDGDMLRFDRPEDGNAVTPGPCPEFRLSDFREIVVIGCGKASARMARSVEEILGDRITRGRVSVKYGHTETLKQIELIEAGHPVPDERSVEAGERIARMAREADARTLVLNLVSGGGSALVSAPFADKASGIHLTLKEKQEVTAALLACGASIHEINCIRKHLSSIKGGRLARLLYPAPSVNLILSDVVGDNLDVIASGLTAPDESTFAEMNEILSRYDILDQMPETVKTILKRGISGRIPDTPKTGDPVFDLTHNLIVGNNFNSLRSARAKAEALGYETVVLSSRITGEAGEAAKFFFGIGADTARHGLLAGKPCCIIGGGETTVTLGETCGGKGGRNQEMALAFLAEMEKEPDISRDIRFLAASTDGNDGPTDAAGAFAGMEGLASARDRNLSVSGFLKRHDAYHFFEGIDFLYKTGATNTNVCDLQVMIVV